MKLSEKILRAFFPEKCPLCGKIIDLREYDCPDCRADVIKLCSDCCSGCGYEKDRCLCAEEEIVLSDFASVYIYSGLIRAQIHQFKFRGNKALGKRLGDDMAFRLSECFLDTDFDLVTYVPMSRSGLKERDYNQSEILARRVAEKFFLPCEGLLIKEGETLKQHKLSADERINNIKGAFALCENTDVKGKTILLCDDVKTTGATLKECEKVLYEGGASKVCSFTLALTDYVI